MHYMSTPMLCRLPVVHGIHLTVVIFSHLTINECLYSTDLVVKQTVASFRLLLGFEIINAHDLQCYIFQQCINFRMQCFMEIRSHLFNRDREG